VNSPAPAAVRTSGLEGPILPTLPPGLPYLLTALGGDGIGPQELAHELQRFPSIAGRLIALANCAWVAPPRPVTGLSDACALLGLRVVRGVSIALSLTNTFNSNRCPCFDARRFWSSALLTADGCTMLARTVRGPADSNTMSTAGLLHNLGLLWMADQWPAETSAAFQTHESRGDIGLMEAQRLTTGSDYCEKGGLLATAWKLPEALAAVLHHHRTPHYDGPHAALVASVGAVASVAAGLCANADPTPLLSEPVFPGLEAPASHALFEQLVRRRESIGELAKALIGDSRQLPGSH
jgi:HD-like signal output (HDOD) protein